jgi:hypothetical protein
MEDFRANENETIPKNESYDIFPKFLWEENL